MEPFDPPGPGAGRVIVLGSVNVDHFVYVDAFPRPGETVLARGGDPGLGGKGANQAVAAAALGARVHLVGRVGDDGPAGFARARLRAFGVADDHLTVSAAPTGAAYITVDAAGENTIAVVSGANADADTEGLAGVLDRVAGPGAAGAVALAQGETPAAMTAAFARHCAAAGWRFVLNLAPATELDAGTVALADPLIVNEGEAQAVLRRILGEACGVADTGQARRAAERLVAAGAARSVVITLGAAGAVLAGPAGSRHQPAPRPRAVVDTTGAGDAFAGALAAALAAGADLRQALRWAVAAGSAAVQRRGTTGSYPTRAQLADAAGLPEAAPA